jgi:hypothetical protein
MLSMHIVQYSTTSFAINEKWQLRDIHSQSDQVQCMKNSGRAALLHVRAILLSYIARMSTCLHARNSSDSSDKIQVRLYTYGLQL